VRAHAGGRSGSGALGVYLYGWSSSGSSREPGDWVYLAYSSTGVNAAAPWLPPAPGAFMEWVSADAATAQRYLVNGLAFRIRPSGGTGSPPTSAAAVALDYLEVRVRYTAP
jgi:hypothetical protein